MSDELALRILTFLRERAEEDELTLLAASDRAWDVLLPSYWKETLAVSLELGDWNLRGESFFMRAPEENRAETFHLFLQRNRRPGPWRFAATEDGDISLLASIPRDAVTEEELDRLLGSLIQITDETYVPAMKLGYERGLAEQVERGGPGLDQPPPWAR